MAPIIKSCSKVFQRNRDLGPGRKGRGTWKCRLHRNDPILLPLAKSLEHMHKITVDCEQYVLFDILASAQRFRHVQGNYQVRGRRDYLKSCLLKERSMTPKLSGEVDAFRFERPLSSLWIELAVLEPCQPSCKGIPKSASHKLRRNIIEVYIQRALNWPTEHY